MAKKDIKFTLDTIDSRYSPVGTVKQLDSVFFYIKITENGVTKDLTGQTIKLFAIKEDKKIVEQTTKINITNQREGLVEIELLNAAIQVHGFTYFELEISDSNGIISTSDFILRVNKRVGSDEAIESTNEVATLKKIEEYVAQAKVELQNFKKLQTAMLETNNSLNSQEELRVEAESLRITAEEGRVAAETKREEAFNKIEGRITANTEELELARTATTGEEFNSLDERIDCEVDRLNRKIEISFLQQEGKESHVIENTVDGMTTDMIVKGRTLRNLFGSYSQTWVTNKWNNSIPKVECLKPSTVYTLVLDVSNNNIDQSFQICCENSNNTTQFMQPSYSIKGGTDKRYILKVTSKAEVSACSNSFYTVHNPSVFNGGSCDVKAMLLEGDWTQKYIPPYFEGIKSFGGQEGNKISVASNGENLNSSNLISGTIDFNTGNYKPYEVEICSDSFIKLKKGTYTIKSDVANISIFRYTVDEKYLGYLTNFSGKYGTFTLDEDSSIKFRIVSKDTSINVNIVEGGNSKPYQPYKQDKKDILLSQYGFDEGLRGIKNITDELNSIRSVAIKRIGKREYREGDLLLENVITDKVNTYFVLEEPIETPLNENINSKTFGEKTYVSFENSLSGTSSFKVPVNAAATISRLSRDNKALEEENLSLRQDLESTTLMLTDSDLALVKQNVDMDFRLMEVEFALDIPQAILSSNINFKNKKGEVKSMARSPYEMMKIVILSGDYDREDYMHKVGKYHERGRMTKEEQDELMSLMTADEVISK